MAQQAWAQGGGAPTTPQALNRYAYAQNAPLRCTDPTGHWIESAVDIAFIAYDIWDIHQNGLTWDNGLALAADVDGLLLPGLTGLGMAVRGGKAAVEAASHSDEVVDAGRAVAKAAGHVDDAADAAQAAGDARDIKRFYHATSAAGRESLLAAGIDRCKGRINLDFNPAGQGGFYVTQDAHQAAKWAVRRYGEQGVIIEFAVATTDLQQLNGKIFFHADQEWAAMVIAGRQGRLQHEYDYVEGPMLRNPGYAVRGLAPPVGSGHQLAIFTDRAVELFNRGMLR